MINLNKEQWKTYNFGEISFNISERVEPKQTDLDIYVGLEHLDSDCLHIKRKGNPSDVKGIKLRVYPGDIIFGKRRAYQRKAAIVDFDGICSAHAMVVRANPKIISPALLPHFMHSDLFMHRAVDISEGSLSPTIKWKILTQQQFKLPPLDEQKRIADLLWSIDETVEKWLTISNKMEVLINSMAKRFMDSYSKDREGKIREILIKNSEFKVGKVPQSEYLDHGKYPIIDQSKTEIAGYSNNEDLVYRGELPVLVFGDHTTEIKYVDYPFILGADGTKIVKPILKVNTRYLFYAIRNMGLKPVGYRRHFSILKDSKIKIPEIKDQENCVIKLDKLINKNIPIEQHINNLKRIQKQIINQIFG